MNAAPQLVSAIIPAWNASIFLAQAVASVNRQKHPALEILVVDDGSTDATATIAASLPGVQLIRRPNGGPAAARNLGLAHARGGIIAFLDADDLWSDDKLALQLPRLAALPHPGMVLGRRQYLHLARVPQTSSATEVESRSSVISSSVGPADQPLDGPRFEPCGEPEMALNLSCALVHREIFERTGGFDESLRHCDDWDWFMRCRELGVPMVMHDEVTLLQRIHRTNLTRNREAGEHFTVAMLKRSLDRRRAQGKDSSLPPLSAAHERSGKKES